MLPLRLVVDTNILVSAALKPDGLQRSAFVTAMTSPARMYVSKPVFDEYEEVLSRPELDIRRSLRMQMLQLIKNRSHTVSPRYRLQVCGDPNDNIFIECADAAGADYLITGNLKHFPQFWKRTKIITAREFISLAAPHLLGK